MLGLGLTIPKTPFPFGEFSPADISGLKLWLDASQITGLNDGDAVTTWADLSGNGNDATQATVSKKPLYKTAIQNGRPGLLSDGVDDLLSGSVTAPQPCTVVVVIKGVTNIVGSKIFITPNPSRCDLFHNAGAFALFANSVSAGQAGIWQDPNIVAGLFDGSSSRIYVNAAGSGDVDPNTGGYTSGTYNLFDFDGTYSYGDSMYFFEVMIYNRKISFSEVGLLRGYLNAKWAIY